MAIFLFQNKNYNAGTPTQELAVAKNRHPIQKSGTPTMERKRKKYPFASLVNENPSKRRHLSADARTQYNDTHPHLRKDFVLMYQVA